MLGASLDIERTLEQLSRLVAGRYADWCAIHLASDADELRLAGLAHADPERRASLASAEFGVAGVIRGGSSELPSELPAELVAVGIHSCLIVPLQARGRTFGAMTLAWAETERSYDERDVEFALDVAGRAAVALDNAQLYRRCRGAGAGGAGSGLCG